MATKVPKPPAKTPEGETLLSRMTLHYFATAASRKSTNQGVFSARVRDAV